MFVNKKTIRYIAKHFRFTEESLSSMLIGEQGDKKQLFADVVVSYYKIEDFINNLKEGKKSKKKLKTLSI